MTAQVKKRITARSKTWKMANKSSNNKSKIQVALKRSDKKFMKKQENRTIKKKDRFTKKGVKPIKKIMKETDDDTDDQYSENEDVQTAHAEDGQSSEKEENQSTEEGEIESSEKDTTNSSKKEEAEKVNIQATKNTIFVGNLPATFDKRDVMKLFKTLGPVESARIRSIVPEKEKLSPKVAAITKRIHPKVNSVNAYVVFKNSASIEKALAMNGKKVDGHQIRVDRAGMPKAKKETLTSRKKSVFVGNLRFDIRNDDLIDHFSKVGTVNYVRLVRDASTGLGKGFGFVVFNERASVKKALELNETDFKGRSLRVKKVDDGQKPKKNKS